MQPIRVRERGQITLPKKIRQKVKIEPNSIIYANELSDGIYLRSQKSFLYEVQKKGQELMRKKGITMDELLKDLINEKE